MYTFLKVRAILKNWYEGKKKDEVYIPTQFSKLPISVEKLDILRAIDFLTTEYKNQKHYTVITGYYITALDVKEIAQILNISVPYVWKLKNQGIEIMKDYLNGEYK